MGKDKIAVFDFCETLVPYQSAELYVDYVLQSCPTYYINRFYRFMYKLLRKFKIIRLLEHISNGKVTNKILYVNQIRHYTYQKLDLSAKQFYQNCIRPQLIQETIQALRDYQSKGYRIIIVSGGYDIYLKYFAADNGISANDVISTKLQFKDNRFIGKFDGIDCMREAKVSLLENMIDRNNSYVIAFSDSETDIPLLKWADESYVVIRDPSWPKDNNFFELHWKS